jgi:hypothetical protein
MGQRINQQDKAHHQMMLLSRTGSDSVLQNHQGILVELVGIYSKKDTCMRLHAIQVDGDMNVKGRIIIKSPDTDVLLLCIHFFPSMRNTKELWFKTGDGFLSYSKK